MRPQILKTWDQSFATVLFKHYISPLSVYSQLWSHKSDNEISFFINELIVFVPEAHMMKDGHKMSSFMPKMQNEFKSHDSH